MTSNEYLDILKNEIHSTVFATVDEQGLPAARVIDIMLTDEKGVYFITAKGKAFYRQLMDKKYAAISGMTAGEGSLNKKAISVRGKVRSIGKERLEEVFEKNPYMAEIYQEEESRMALEVFQLYEGQGEYFDLSVKPVHREVFHIGCGIVEDGGYYISEDCIVCGVCYGKCPQKCIEKGKTFRIRKENCLHCGNCAAVCPAQAVRKR